MPLEFPPVRLCTGDHLVQFYEQDSVLVETVGRRLIDALRAGAAAVIIASEPHRLAFEAELGSAGIDPVGAVRDGTLRSLDAAATLSFFRPDGMIDPAAFRRVIGGLLREAGAGGRRVIAYGEMVALLWEAGDVPGTLELEELWNELGREFELTLMCGYPAAAVAGEENAQTLAQIRRLHSSVLTGPDEAARRFAPTRDAPGGARRFVTGLLRGWGCPDTIVDDAQLVISELTTNAVVHAGSDFEVVARQVDGVLRLSVRDQSPVSPGLREGVRGGDSGHGLHLIAALADGWGVDSADQGKAVWAELRP